MRTEPCPYRKIITMMPYPFAMFDKKGNRWTLSAFNNAFSAIFQDSEVGQEVTSFPFTVMTGRSEIQVGSEYYSLYSFGLTDKQMVVFMHDITSRHRIDDAINQVLQAAVTLI